jgi:hypothetical protein
MPPICEINDFEGGKNALVWVREEDQILIPSKNGMVFGELKENENV